MPLFKANDIDLYYEDTGHGRPLILFHGLTSSSAMFYREINFFGTKRRVIAMDSRGHGHSGKQESYTLEDHIQDAIALLDHLQLEQADVLGISMGSYIAQGLAARRPESVRKLLLVATKSFGEQSSMTELFDRYPEEFDGLSIRDKLANAESFMYHRLTAVKKWQKKTAENSLQLTLEQQGIASRALESFDLRHELQKIQAETLVISGRYDELNPSDSGRETARLTPHASFLEFKRSGHAPNVEQVRLFLGIAENFFDE
ncbi:alpha/beta hydrolase [Planococcus sp. ISL-109]|uniref:alpha/beta fold hydrolase n=1 Tax=Planococcus sp. ISL-109 TaxID=2819166 RepID=UPI001BE76697|nr:alpha/beta hydrolase [Planococcus sp. ISL-109]MBT2583390.1 alpha/beta fold hydrolase [Planococcus sp. ISL-109]